MGLRLSFLSWCFFLLQAASSGRDSWRASKSRDWLSSRSVMQSTDTPPCQADGWQTHIQWMVWVLKSVHYWLITQKRHQVSKCNQTHSLLLYNSVWRLPTAKLTLLRIRGAVPGRDDSLGVSEVELRDDVLLENSLLAPLTLEVRWRKDSINSVGSLCSSRWASCRCLCVRSLEMTCDSGMPNTWGMVSVWGVRARNISVHLAGSKLTGKWWIL